MHYIPQLLKARVYNPLRNCYIDLNAAEGLDKGFLFSPLVMIKYQVDIPQDPEQFNLNDSDSPSGEKKERNK